MKRLKTLVPLQLTLDSALAVALLAVTARAGVTVAVQSGNSIKGTLDPVDEVETYTFKTPANALLTVKAKGGSPVSLRIKDGDGAEVVTDRIKVTKTGAVAKKVALQRGGDYAVEIFARDGASAGDYAMKIQWKSPKKYGDAPAATADGGTVEFRADGGALVSAKIAAGKKSPVVPRITALTGPNGFELLFGAEVVGQIKKVEVPAGVKVVAARMNFIRSD